MDAIKYLKEVDRLCDSIDDCEDCPIHRLRGALCHNKQMHSPEKAIEIVEKWSKENPQKTMLQDFLEKYPNAPLIDRRPTVCPSSLGYVKEDEEKCYEDCYWCWNRPLEG